jgi:hypothetical protein
LAVVYLGQGAKDGYCGMRGLWARNAAPLARGVRFRS